MHGVEGDHRDARLIEDAVPQLHHLHGSAVPASDLRGQLLPEDGHLLAIRRAHVSRKVSRSCVPIAERGIEHQVGKPACRQPGKIAAVVHPPEREASVAVEAVPAQVGRLESFPAHGRRAARRRERGSRAHRSGRYLRRRPVRAWERGHGSQERHRDEPVHPPHQLDPGTF